MFSVGQSSFHRCGPFTCTTTYIKYRRKGKSTIGLLYRKHWHTKGLASMLFLCFFFSNIKVFSLTNERVPMCEHLTQWKWKSACLAWSCWWYTTDDYPPVRSGYMFGRPIEVRLKNFLSSKVKSVIDWWKAGWTLIQKSPRELPIQMLKGCG